MKLEDSVSNFKMFCKATLIKTVWCIDQRHRIESPEIDLFGYSQVIFLTEVQAYFHGERIVFSNIQCWKTGYPYV